MKNVIQFSIFTFIYFTSGCAVNDDLTESYPDPKLLGKWNSNSILVYNNVDCEGIPNPQDDGVQPTIELEFTEKEIDWVTLFSVPDSLLCFMASGEIIGDSCSILEGLGSVAIDSLCINTTEGNINSGICTYSDTLYFNYSTDNSAITIIENEGTDSIHTVFGHYQIIDDVLSMDVTDDSTCTHFEMIR